MDVIDFFCPFSSGVCPWLWFIIITSSFQVHYVLFDIFLSFYLIRHLLREEVDSEMLLLLSIHPTDRPTTTMTYAHQSKPVAASSLFFFIFTTRDMVDWILV